MDYQPAPELDDVGTTPRRIIFGLAAILAATWSFSREVDLAAYPGGNMCCCALSPAKGQRA